MFYCSVDPSFLQELDKIDILLSMFVIASVQEIITVGPNLTYSVNLVP